MDTITIAAMIRDEAERYLPSALEAWNSIADRTIILDNGSQDHTKELTDRYDTIDYHYEPTPAWGSEAPIRRRLFQEAAEATEVGGWIFVLDADMMPARNPRRLPLANADALFFNLYDLWDETEQGVRYRTDGHWKAHERWRCWAVRHSAPPADGWQWPERGIHCGHFPQNLDIRRPLYAPLDYGLLHYAFSRNEDRERKFEQYLEEADQLTERELRHAESILDDDPRLASLPFEPQYQLTYGR